MKAYVVNTDLDGYYNKHQIELNNINDFCSFINDCLKAGKEVIVKRIDDEEPYFTFEIYDDYRE